MKRLPLALLAWVIALTVSAQPNVVDTQRFDFESNLSKDQSIPSPKEYLGYELGENFTIYAHIVEYYKKLAEASPRVIYNEYGETYEGRPLINLIISSEANISNIDGIQQTHMNLLQPNSNDAQSVIDNQPVVTSFSYNIHGNEASTAEAAMQVAYRMASATDEETKTILDRSIIVLFVCINPDGRDRYVYWYKTSKRIKR